MQYEFIMPEWATFEEKRAGVYKMVLDKKWFYIGSSINLYVRLLKWKYRMRDNAPRNANIRKILPEIKIVEFELLEEIIDDTDPKIREDFYIHQYEDYEFLLNRAKSAFTVKGAKRTVEEIAALKERLKKVSKKVAIVDDCNNIIEQFDSVASLSMSLGMKGRNISRAFKYNNRTIVGKKVRKIDQDGNIILPPAPPPKKPKSKGYKMPEGFGAKISERIRAIVSSPDYIKPEHSKKVYQYAVNGELVATHLSIRDAARSMNVERKSFINRIKDSPRNYCKGFIWKF